MTKDKTRAMITELRLKRPTNRTLTNKQQCNPEDSRKQISERESAADFSGDLRKLASGKAHGKDRKCGSIWKSSVTEKRKLRSLREERKFRKSESKPKEAVKKEIASLTGQEREKEASENRRFSES